MLTREFKTEWGTERQTDRRKDGRTERGRGRERGGGRQTNRQTETERDRERKEERKKKQTEEELYCVRAYGLSSALKLRRNANAFGSLELPLYKEPRRRPGPPSSMNAIQDALLFTSLHPQRRPTP